MSDEIIIQLTRGFSTVINTKPFLSEFKWKARFSRGKIYASRLKTEAGRRVPVHLHREIIDANPSDQVDHINGDSLDNRIENLRICTTQQNAFNRLKNRTSASGFKGVSWEKKRQQWRSTITCSARMLHLGYFDDRILAARAYDLKATELYGEFARVNFPKEIQVEK